MYLPTWVNLLFNAILIEVKTGDKYKREKMSIIYVYPSKHGAST